MKEQVKQKNCLKIALFILSILLFITSLFLPAFYTEYRLLDDVQKNGVSFPAKAYEGWLILLIGWVGIIGYSVAWYANIGLMITMVLYQKKHVKTLQYAAISLIIAATSVFFDFGHLKNIYVEYKREWGSGYYCWIASYLCLFIGALLQKNDHSNHS